MTQVTFVRCINECIAAALNLKFIHMKTLETLDFEGETPPFQCKYFCKLLCPILTAVEWLIFGTAVKIFTIAVPVIVYGTIASVIYVVIY